MRKVVRVIAGLVLLAAILAAIGYHNARAAPAVRRASIVLPGWPRGAAPVTVALLADIHMQSASMEPRRLRRIVKQIDALHPDLIVLAGDFIEGERKREAADALPLLAGPLGGLRAPLGVIAVLGNHDHWTDAPAVVAMLRARGITVLDNQAVRRGPLAIGGVDDLNTHHARSGKVVAAMRRLPGARLLISHTPDVVHHLPDDVHLVLAGHTHCGQIVLPVIGALASVADPRYRCGLVRDPGRAVIVTAGLGTTLLPLRFGAPPDVWLVRVSGPASSAR
ncbi:metallophosphoesterase [Hephaestia mangrovi]|uniref:metallophosphoesterase n=1 Tax=Hephaestia mangrovi TaxID=2873268 RepID=UPI001CA6B0DA|nr:metallophosphoesterase [Hephaestia mangrovi]MBY8829553.1 metallophosphoesterase [Hephaestia mangrovi]